MLQYGRWHGIDDTKIPLINPNFALRKNKKKSEKTVNGYIGTEMKILVKIRKNEFKKVDKKRIVFSHYLGYNRGLVAVGGEGIVDAEVGK